MTPLPTDPLDLALGGLQPRGVFLHRTELRGRWGFTAAAGPAAYHIVEAGRCHIEAGGVEAVLAPGDLAVIPHGAATTFRDAPDTPAEPIDRFMARHPMDAQRVIRTGGEGEPTVLVCGGVAFDDAVPHPVLDALPALLVVPAQAHGETPWLANTIGFLTCESRSVRAGSSTIMGYLGSVLFVQAVRAAVAEGERAPGWLAALGDRQVGPALQAILRAPGRPWTVEELGREAGLGRSAFAARFREAVGESPMQHVTRWRMYEAGRHLRADATLAEAAASVGYESEAAFGRAFRQWTGGTAGAVRRAA